MGGVVKIFFRVNMGQDGRIFTCRGKIQIAFAFNFLAFNSIVINQFQNFILGF